MGIDFNKVKEIVSKYGLKQASQRELPLLATSCIALGFTSFLRKLIGFSYEVIGAYGSENYIVLFFNEDSVIEWTFKSAEKNKGRIYENVIKPIHKIAEDIKNKIGEFDNARESEENLLSLLELYPSYIALMGVYNCFWRLSTREEAISIIGEEVLNKIANERESLAKVYPKIEEIIKKLVSHMGEKYKIDGDLLRYVSFNELKQALDKKCLSELVFLAEARKKGYFYLYLEKGNEEFIVSDPKIVRRVKKEFFEIKEDIREFSGKTAFKGTARGIVVNLITGKHNRKVDENTILVASNTHPDDIQLIKKCKAIVTDEGGIISHAAIVARELKKPCIIGTKIATRILKDGDLVEVDADNGVVRRLS